MHLCIPYSFSIVHLTLLEFAPVVKFTSEAQKTAFAMASTLPLFYVLLFRCICIYDMQFIAHPITVIYPLAAYEPLRVRRNYHKKKHLTQSWLQAMFHSQYISSSLNEPIVYPEECLRKLDVRKFMLTVIIKCIHI